MYALLSDPLAPLEFLSKEDLAYRQLRSAILTGVITPGQRVTIRELAARFGVSTMPVRQALMRLEGERLVSRLPAGGVVAAPLSALEVEEIYAMRVVLEGLAARLAALRLTEPELGHMSDLVVRMRAAQSRGDIPSLMEVNTEFHFVIYRAARNERLFETLRNLWDVCFRYRHLSYADPAVPGGTLQDHVRTLDAMQRRDADEAEKWVRADMERTAARLLDRLTSPLDGLAPAGPPPGDPA